MRKLFPSQTEQEQICLVVREHWIYFAQKAMLWGIFALIYIVFRLFGPTYIPVLFGESVIGWTNLLGSLYLLVLWLSIFLLWVFYYLNIQVITSIRIVDVDQIGLFSRTASELNIEKVQDVTSEIHGMLGTVFDYGMVYIQTAGEKERFTFSNVPHPGKIQTMVHDLYEQHTHQHPLTNTLPSNETTQKA